MPGLVIAGVGFLCFLLLVPRPQDMGYPAEVATSPTPPPHLHLHHLHHHLHLHLHPTSTFTSTSPCTFTSLCTSTCPQECPGPEEAETEPLLEEEVDEEGRVGVVEVVGEERAISFLMALRWGKCTGWPRPQHSADSGNH